MQTYPLRLTETDFHRPECMKEGFRTDNWKHNLFLTFQLEITDVYTNQPLTSDEQWSFKQKNTQFFLFFF